MTVNEGSQTHCRESFPLNGEGVSAHVNGVCTASGKILQPSSVLIIVETMLPFLAKPEANACFHESVNCLTSGPAPATSQLVAHQFGIPLCL